jgi:hypothetical protein
MKYLRLDLHAVREAKTTRIVLYRVRTLWAGLVKTTLAPRKRMSLRRSIEKASDMTQTSPYPLAAHTMARPIPVSSIVVHCIKNSL